jgi:transposase
MHDNDPKHTARRTRDRFDEVDISVLEWTAYSPDLNPIENLWFQLDIECKERKCNNEEELMNTLKKGWNALPITRLQNLMDSIQAVIKCNGYMAK